MSGTNHVLLVPYYRTHPAVKFQLISLISFENLSLYFVTFSKGKVTRSNENFRKEMKEISGNFTGECII